MADNTTTEIKSPRERLGSIMMSIAGQLARMQPGPLASLRRGPHKGAGSATFWAVMAKAGAVDERRAPAWRTIVQAVAILTPKGDGDKPLAQDFKIPFGSALEAAGVSELRMMQWLGSRGASRVRMTTRLAQSLAQKGMRQTNLATLAELIVYDEAEASDRIARDYYRAQYQSKRRKTEQDEGGNA